MQLYYKAAGHFLKSGCAQVLSTWLAQSSSENWELANSSNKNWRDSISKGRTQVKIVLITSCFQLPEQWETESAKGWVDR